MLNTVEKKFFTGSFKICLGFEGLFNGFFGNFEGFLICPTLGPGVREINIKMRGGS